MNANQIAEEALKEIAFAGMSPSPEMSEDGIAAWHARQAWRFIGIAARALEESSRAAIKAKAVQVEPVAWTEKYIDEYLEDYELFGEDDAGRDCCYTPNENDKALIKDAMMGFTSFVPFATPQQPAPEIDRLRASNAELLTELQAIANANPKNWDAPLNDTASFQAWAQSRARAAIAAQGEKP